MTSEIRKLLDAFSVDWSDFEQASAASQALIREIGANKTYLKELLLGVLGDQHLMLEAESHQLMDRIVLYEADARGFRLRLNVSTDETLDRPHDHRFSFSSYILNGGYMNRFFDIDTGDYEGGLAEKIHFQDRFHTDPAFKVTPDCLTLLAITEEVKGSCYSLHHSAFHSVETQRDTVSLFLRGPAEKEYSLIYDKAHDQVWWRFGKARESAERRKKITMSPDRIGGLIERMASLGVI